MKYITPNVPNIKITTKEGKEILIDYVYEIEMITLNEKTLIMIETPLSDTSMDELNNTDTYKMHLNFRAMDVMCNDIESKKLDFKNMELKLKIDTYQTGCAERKIYAFYNSKEEAIYDVIDTILNNKYYQFKNNKNNDLYFAKVRESAKIPTKDDENMGYDIYANFEEDYMLINPHETKMIPTGICSACSEDYAIVLKERGSTGTKGIGQRCGVIDSGYRNEWFVPITNTNDKPLIISKKYTGKKENKEDDKTEKIEALIEVYGQIAPNSIVYPYIKAICQAVVLPVPKMNVKEISLEELKAIPSKRGEGCLGSSGK